MPFLGKGWLHVAWLAHLSKRSTALLGMGMKVLPRRATQYFSFRLAHVPVTGLAHVPVTGLSFVTAMLLGQVSKRRMDPGFSALFWLVKLRIRGSDTSKASNALEQVVY